MLSKIIFFLSLALSLQGFANNPFQTNPFQIGTYRGFGPTDESAIQLGEVALVVIDDHSAVLRYATGLVVEERQMDITNISKLSTFENAELGLKAEIPAFRGDSSKYPLFVFNHSSPHGKVPKTFKSMISKILGLPSLHIYTGGMGDMITPIFLYSPAQVAAGQFDKLLAKFEKSFGRKNIVPRLHFNGKAVVLQCKDMGH